MIGQYPAQTPERNSPSLPEVQGHVQSLVEDAEISLFCSLQSELPPQSDDEAWDALGGQVYLSPASLRKEFPNAFVHYAPMVRDAWSADTVSNNKEPKFLHAPIEDLNVPSSSSDLYALLSQLIHEMHENDHVIYLHCWGGRGRAGLVGACLLSLLYPEMKDPDQILGLVQAGYDSRAGSESMPLGLKRSPQTEGQRDFVRGFVAGVQLEVRKQM